MLLVNSPSIHRVEVKGSLLFGRTQHFAQKYWQAQVLSEGVKELLHFRSHDHDDILGIFSVFPKLASLEVEYDAESSHSDPTKVSEALLNISKTLENPSLTTVPRKPWRDADMLPLLPTLNQMAVLKHLTTESIRLFGRRDPLSIPQPADILPTSLSCFRLIDYWGTSDTNIFGPPLPNSLSLLEFYDQAFSNLYENCATRLHNLKSILLALHSTSGGNGQDPPADVQVFLLKFQALFAGIGVRFSIIESEMLKFQFQSFWANIA